MTGRRRLPDLVRRLPETRAALEYAELQHAGQRRSSDGAPFIEHPLEVGQLLYGEGAPDHLIAAGVLHDVLEKTAVTEFQLTARFGRPIASLVAAVSENDSIHSYGQRKAALRHQVAATGPDALLIFAADKISKVRELRAALAQAALRGKPVDRALLPPHRLAHFRHCLGMLEERLPDARLVKQLSAELAGLNRELKHNAAVTRAPA